MLVWLLALGAVSGWCELLKFYDTGSVNSVDYSFDRKYIASTVDGQVTVWDAQTKMVVHRLQVANARWAKFSLKAATNLIAVSDKDSNIHLIDLTTLADTTFASGHGAGVTKF